VLSERAISRLAWLSRHAPPRTHVANVSLHLNVWHSKCRYQQNKFYLMVLLWYNRQVVDSLEHISNATLLAYCFLYGGGDIYPNVSFSQGGQDVVLSSG
jgi:hypothetical protein